MKVELNDYSEQFEYGTARIVCNDGESVGTGFFFEFNYEEGMRGPVLITNKHVLEGMDKLQIHLHTTNMDGEDYIPADAITIIGLKPYVVNHPDPEIDLCAVRIVPGLESFKKKGRLPHMRFFYETNIFQRDNQHIIHKSVKGIETIHMTGYPSGLWDDVNNKPLTRRGITASNVRYNWRGKPNFMVDVACFPGSSGSPVYIYDEDFQPNQSVLNVGNNPRCLLLGVLHSGPQVEVDGKVEIVDVPTTLVPLVKSKFMMNLGVCVAAEKILELKELV